ncbi:Transposable element Tc3 transposase, partial [Camponotus floridanus]
NPHWHRAVDRQHRWSLMVWCGIVNGYLVGPYFFEQNVDRNSYLELIRDRLPVLLEDVDLETRRRMWFQQDGAAPHFAHIVRNFLNENYNGRWIGREGPVNWPPNSPDLTSPDFYLWGFLKNQVFQQRPTDVADMQNRIRQACAAIPRQTLLNTVRHFQRRLTLCLQTNGGNVEHL